MNYHSRLISVLEENMKNINEGIATLSDCIKETLNNGKFVWLIGNGGSASTIEHFETDLNFIRFPLFDISSKVIALTSNSSLFSAAANDDSYSEVFAALIRKKTNQGDLLITVSASGNSPNIINAIKKAKELGLTTFSIIGFDGGKNLGLSDFEILIKSEIGEYEVVEDIHLSIFHATKLRILLTN